MPPLALVLVATEKDITDMEDALDAAKRAVPLSYLSAHKAVDAVSKINKMVQQKGRVDAALIHHKFTAKGLRAPGARRPRCLPGGRERGERPNRVSLLAHRLPGPCSRCWPLAPRTSGALHLLKMRRDSRIPTRPALPRPAPPCPLPGKEEFSDTLRQVLREKHPNVPVIGWGCQKKAGEQGKEWHYYIVRRLLASHATRAHASPPAPNA